MGYGNSGVPSPPQAVPITMLANLRELEALTKETSFRYFEH